ncbi:MAG: hypothetical protein ASARMPRED_007270 [Alectoria sarmentosa]|nr:MAG: hypothetical protein ASARMPRED_007270 [Alectoria sarmentosa]
MTTRAATTTSDIAEGQVESRVRKGALVTFGPGARVLSVEHPSDYSAIQVSCTVPQQSTAGHVASYLFDLREPVGLPRIHVITGPGACPVIAHVQMKDPSFAARVKGKFDGYLKYVPRTKMSIRSVPVEIGYEESVDPPYMTPLRRHLLHDRHERLRIEEDPVVSECAVCLTEAEDPYHTTCGHWYCRACVVSQCYSVGKDEIPIRCLGNSGKCSRIFLLPELKSALPSDAFEQFLAKSSTAYFRTITTIQECPTSHCRQTYRASTDGSVITCLRCSTPICTTCHAPSHSGVTCATHQRSGTAEYQSWTFFNEHVRKCPRCRNLIEKTGGCERVDCLCGAGLCWKCMELWDGNGQCRCGRIASGAQKG